MLFAFHFILSIQSLEYSVHSMRPREAETDESKLEANKRQSLRSERLREVYRTFQHAYMDHEDSARSQVASPLLPAE